MYCEMENIYVMEEKGTNERTNRAKKNENKMLVQIHKHHLLATDTLTHMHTRWPNRVSCNQKILYCVF